MDLRIVFLSLRDNNTIRSDGSFSRVFSIFLHISHKINLRVCCSHYVRNNIGDTIK